MPKLLFECQKINVYLRSDKSILTTIIVFMISNTFQSSCSFLQIILSPTLSRNCGTEGTIRGQMLLGNAYKLPSVVRLVLISCIPMSIGPILPVARNITHTFYCPVHH